MGVGKRHDKIDIRQGVTQLCRFFDIGQGGVVAFVCFSVMGPHQIGAGAEIRPAPTQVHDKFPFAVVNRNVVRGRSHGLLHHFPGNFNGVFTLQDASGVLQKAQRALVHELHAPLFQHAQGAIEYFFFILL